MNRWLSRKMVMALVGVLAVILTSIGLPETIANSVAENIAQIIMLYLVGQGAADFMKERKNGENGG